jgi:uncharacterized membrane protein (DUF106 family)
MIPLAGMVYGAVTIWIFRRVARREAILAAAKRIQAHLLEFWLFVDDPRAIAKSWKHLLGANARLLRLVMVPFLLLSILSLPLFLWLDARYGTSSLPVGKPSVVTLDFDGPANSVPNLVAPEGISVETPPVLVPSLHQVSWRIRPVRALSGELKWDSGSTRPSKSVIAGDGNAYHWSVWFLASSVLGAILARYFIRAAAIRSRS